MKRLFKFKYPKITLLIICIFLSYLIFTNPNISSIVSALGNWGYLGLFIAGFLLSLGFTSPFAVGFFITLNPSNLLFACAISAIGATVANLIILHSLRFSFADEFYRLEHTHPAKKFSRLIEKDLGHRAKIYLIYLLAGFFIASPLPNEAGIVMLAGLTKINSFAFSFLSFVLGFIGILSLILL